jgi:hypothetical protein
VSIDELSGLFIFFSLYVWFNRKPPSEKAAGIVVKHGRFLTYVDFRRKLQVTLYAVSDQSFPPGSLVQKRIAEPFPTRAGRSDRPTLSIGTAC